MHRASTAGGFRTVHERVIHVEGAVRGGSHGSSRCRRRAQLQGRIGDASAGADKRKAAADSRGAILTHKAASTYSM